MQPTWTTTTSEGSTMTTTSSIGEGSEMRPFGGSFQYPGSGPMAHVPPSYYQQAPTHGTETTSTSTPGYASTEQPTREAAGDSEGRTTTATTKGDTTKSTQQMERDSAPSYGPWIPAFMCTLVVLLVLFLVPYVFLNVRGHGTPPHQHGQVARQTQKHKGHRTRHASKPTAFRRPYRPPGHYGGLCDDSLPCQGAGNCVKGVCHCDLPHTRVVDGICMSEPKTTSPRATTKRITSTTTSGRTSTSTTALSTTTTSTTTSSPTTKSTTTSSTTTTSTTTTPMTRTHRPSKSTIRSRTKTTLPPSVRFTFVRTVRPRKRPKNPATTTGSALKMQPGRDSTQPTKKPLRPNKGKDQISISSRMAPNITDGTTLHAP